MFQRLQIRYKLLAALLVPLIALAVLAFVQVQGDLTASRQAAKVASLATFSGRVTALIHDLQRERDTSLGYVAGAGESGAGEVAALRAKTDAGALATFPADLRRADLDGYDPLLRGRLDHAQELLSHLQGERRLVDDADPAGLAKVQSYYGDVIASLLDFDTGIALQSSDRRIVRDAAALTLLSRLKELASQERGLVAAVLAADRFTEGQVEQLASVIAVQDTLAAQFRATASSDQREGYSAELDSPNLPELGALRRALLAAAGSGQIGTRSLGDHKQVSSASAVLGEKVNRLRTVELRLRGDLAASSAAARSAARRSALVESVLTALVLVLAVAVALLTGRSIAHPLLRLRDAANQVARRQLPEVVERLRRGEITHLEARAAPVPLPSGGETGQVARAFDAVHQMVVRVAAEQAALRVSIGEMFLNLARRSQDLVGRQLGLIDELEKDAEPEALEQLFKLDHLATRMRRNAESLIVLAGAEPPRRWSQPVPVDEVVRAAISEVQDYQRVKPLPIGDLGLSGQAVADVVHLLAELIDNATSFSPPGTAVQVAGHETSNGYVLEIEDSGLGMSDQELAEANQRLADPPAIDAALPRMLGLHVVGRLARRHGIRAQLRHSWSGGVTALVLVPHELMTSIPRQEIEPPAPARGLTRPPSPQARESSNGHGPSRPEPTPPPAPPPAPPPIPPPIPIPPVAGNGGSPLTGSRLPGPLPRTSLPRRVPRANLAPGLAAEPEQAAGEPDTPPPSPLSRSPDEIRAMLSSYRSGLERGRRMVADSRQADDPAGQDSPGGSGPMAPRSDDDAAQ
jgi:hypothetical protein